MIFYSLWFIYKSSTEFIFDIVNAFHHTEVFTGSIISNCKETPCIWVGWVHIHDKMFQIFHLFLPSVMIAEQLLQKIGLFFFESYIVGISGQYVFEETLQFVDVIIFFITELKLDNLLCFFLGFSLVLQLFLELFPQVINNSIIVVPMLFPKFVEFLSLCFFNLQCNLADF